MVKLNNYARKTMRRGDQDWYEWKVFVDEDNDTLNKIDHVEYLLHPTFPNPRRIVADRESKFALRTGGWGQFRLRARVTFKDESSEEVDYFIDFRKEWPR